MRDRGHSYHIHSNMLGLVPTLSTNLGVLLREGMQNDMK
jgi:hypothetical protein